jgi:uncharacterized membrane protein YfcA
MIEVSLVIAGFVSWTISTLSAGGGSVLFVAAVTILLRGHAIAPVVTLASAMTSPARIILFWSSVDWKVVCWYLPGAVLGAIAGSWVFGQISGRAIKIAIGIFLVSTIWQFRLGDRPKSSTMRRPWFVPVSIVSGLTSAIVGASGLLANPFYLNYGLTKEGMLATRAVNSLVIQLVKLAAYFALGILNWDLVGHGFSAGLGGVLAVWSTRPWLRRLDHHRFRRLSVAVMVIAGLLTLWQQRTWIIALITGG